MNLATLTDRPAVSRFPQRVRFNSECEWMSFDHDALYDIGVSIGRADPCPLRRREPKRIFVAWPNDLISVEQPRCGSLEAKRYDAERVVRQRLLQRQRLRRVRFKPSLHLGRRRQDDRHGLRVNRRDAGVTPFRPRLPPLPQQVEDLERKHHIPILAAFRLHDANDHLLAVDVAHPQPHTRATASRAP